MNFRSYKMLLVHEPFFLLYLLHQEDELNILVFINILTQQCKKKKKKYLRINILWTKKAS